MATAQPTKRCDLVMKGGLTSGAAYPPAIIALKDEYCFGKVGGASAGAIAAAAAAAAELGRRKDGFEQLQALADELRDQPGRLQRLFQPSRATRPVFRLLLRLVQHRSDRVGGIGRVATAVWAVARYLWWWPVLGGAVAVALLWGFAPAVLTAGLSAGQLAAAGIVVAVGMAVGLLVGTVVRARRLVTHHLPANFNGMCSGMTVDRSGTPALTPWLYDHLQKMAGFPANRPVTFADLAAAPLPVGDEGIGLKMMTTDLTQARPVVFPLDNGEQYYYSPQEFAELFPADVVKHLARVSRDWAEIVTDDGPSDDIPKGMPDDLRTLPTDALPIIVATRMSLAFPLLLSAVPLYTHRPRGTRRWVRHWMSDGGIGSNFPIHFFDSWLPRWPTFALSFIPERSKGDGEPSLADRVGTDAWTWQRRGVISSVPTFLSAVLDTMQNWRDTLQSELPGFRDRIAEIPLADGEGGMNLAMDTHAITRLQGKGERAADDLLRDFRLRTHRFHRYEMAMRLLDTNLGAQGLGLSYRHDRFDETIRKDITAIAEELRDLRLPALADQLEERATAEWCAWAHDRTDELLKVAAAWHNGDPGLTFSGEPTPSPMGSLRNVPPV